MSVDYFGSDHEVSVDIGPYELHQYANAQKHYKRMIAYQDDFFESLYDEISPKVTSYDDGTGMAYRVSPKTESAALWIIDQKESYLIRMEKENRRAAMFEKAMESLNSKEAFLIKIRHHGKRAPRFLISNDFWDQLELAEEKVIQHLEEQRQQQIDEIKAQVWLERKAKVKQMIEEWKGE